jgi:hypothetical protein
MGGGEIVKKPKRLTPPTMAMLINEGVKAWICILLAKVVIEREPH